VFSSSQVWEGGHLSHDGEERGQYNESIVSNDCFFV
jgi:hypothetical protein